MMMSLGTIFWPDSDVLGRFFICIQVGLSVPVIVKMKSSEIEKIQPVGTTWNRILNSPSGTMRPSNTCTCI